LKAKALTQGEIEALVEMSLLQPDLEITEELSKPEWVDFKFQLGFETFKLY